MILNRHSVVEKETHIKNPGESGPGFAFFKKTESKKIPEGSPSGWCYAR